MVVGIMDFRGIGEEAPLFAGYLVGCVHKWKPGS